MIQSHFNCCYFLQGCLHGVLWTKWYHSWWLSGNILLQVKIINLLLILIKCLNLTTIIYQSSVYSVVYWWTQELTFQAIVHLSKSKLWYSHGRPCAILCARHWLCVHSHEESGVSYPRIPTHYTHLELVQGMQTGLSSLICFICCGPVV